MKRGFILLSAIALAGNTHAQLYKEGTIIGTAGDSLQCMVKIEMTYSYRIYYKSSYDSPEYFVALKNVKGILTKDQYFENLPVNKKDKLVQLAIDGRDSLFYYLTEEKGPIKKENGMTSYGIKMHYNYILKKNGAITELIQKDFKEKLLGLLTDCPFIMELLKDDKTVYEQLPNIIEQYNRCNN